MQFIITFKSYKSDLIIKNEDFCEKIQLLIFNDT